MPLIKVADIELAWFAGFYEGEGTICNDISNSNHIRVMICQNDKTPLERALQLWKGSLRKRERKSPASDKICTNYEWKLCNKDAKLFIDDIRPYLRIPYKMDQIKNALEKEKEIRTERYDCTYCDKSYATQQGRRKHERDVHKIKENELIYRCSVCNKTFKYEESKIRHELREHQQEPDASYT